MIHPSGTFEYEAEFTSESFRDSDIVLQGTSLSVDNMDRLVGHNPKIRFWNDRLVLVASGELNSTVRNVSFAIGNAVPLAARPGDRLYLVRTGAGGIGLSLLRQERVVLAIGAIAAVPLGRDLQAISHSEGMNHWRHFAADTSWLEFRVGSERLILREREVSEIGDYYIYIERVWGDGVPGTDECVSVCVADDSAMKIAAIRSAILLGNGKLKMTSWDCIEHFTAS
jgi:hypothetical protein